MFKNFFQKPSKAPPFTDVEVILKQINPADLSDFGREALNQAFTGFYDEEEESQNAKEAREFFNNVFGRTSSQFAYTAEKVQPGESKSYRRYAGDSGLPRGRYYSVCIDENGNDNGTLVREILAYHNAIKVGLVEVVDSTNPDFSKQAFEMIGNKKPHLIISFFAMGEKINSFARPHLLNSDKKHLSVALPLRITREVRQNILDLRQPEAAEWFTRELTRLSSNPDSLIRIVDPRLPLNSFFELLPTLLEQGLGGSDYLNVAGAWLRSLGAQGLVFPSARNDITVTFQRQKLISSTGFNFVDFSNAPEPRLLTSEGEEMPIVLQGLHYWPQYPQYTPAFHKLLNEKLPEKERTPWVVNSVKSYYVPKGINQGSWKLEGLRDVTIAKYRFGQAVAVLMLLREKEKLSEESTIYLLSWLQNLYDQAEIEQLDSLSYSIMMIALYNDESLKEGMTNAIQDMETHQINPELVQAVREFLEIKTSKQTDKDAQEGKIHS